MSLYNPQVKKWKELKCKCGSFMLRSNTFLTDNLSCQMISTGRHTATIHCRDKDRENKYLTK